MAFGSAPDIFGGATGDKFGYTAHFVGSSGSDTYPNATNSSTPCSLATAVSSAAPGDLVLIMDDGTYSIGGNINFAAGGAGSAWVVVAGTGNQNGADANNGRPLLQASGMSANEDIIGNASTGYQWFENLEVDGNTSGGENTDTGFYLGGLCVAYNCVCYDTNENGFLVQSRTYALFCLSYGNAGLGIYQSSNGVVAFCHCYDNGGGGIATSSPSVPTLFNVCQNNGDFGIDAQNAGQAVWFNTCDGNATDGIVAGYYQVFIGNILSNHGGPPTRFGYDPDDSSGNQEAYLFNHYYNNDTDVDATVVIEAEKTTGDPAYTDAGNGDYSIGSSSPAANLELALATLDATFVNTFMDKGAMQRQVTAGGGGGLKLVGPGGLAG